MPAVGRGRMFDRVIRRAVRPTPHAIRPVRHAAVSVSWAFDSARNLLRALPASLLVLLLAFHAWLLVTGIQTGRILDLDVALRWVAGLALSAVLLAFKRHGVPLLRGRKAVVLWALVVVLHAHAMATRPEALSTDTPTTSTFVAVVVQLGGSVGAALGLVLVALAARLAASHTTPRRLVRLLTSDTLAHVRAGGIVFAAPRPPPVLA